MCRLSWRSNQHVALHAKPPIAAIIDLAQSAAICTAHNEKMIFLWLFSSSPAARVGERARLNFVRRSR
jgi:hypothetical protein